MSREIVDAIKVLEQEKGLALGADDYIPKPFSPREVVLRVQAVLRRLGREGEESATLEVGDLHLDIAGHRLQIDDKEIALTATEFRLLRLLRCVFRRPRHLRLQQHRRPRLHRLAVCNVIILAAGASRSLIVVTPTGQFAVSLRVRSSRTSRSVKSRQAPSLKMLQF